MILTINYGRTYGPYYNPCHFYKNFKIIKLTEKYGSTRFPYFNIIETNSINRVYPIQTEKSELISNYFDRRYSKKDFPKKLRTKDNYKKIENELLILNQDERELDYLTSTIYGSNRKIKYDDYTLILQTNLSFDQAMIIKSYFTLDDLKKFRGFQITNSN